MGFGLSITNLFSALDSLSSSYYVLHSIPLLSPALNTPTYLITNLIIVKAQTRKCKPSVNQDRITYSAYIDQNHSLDSCL